MKKLLLFPLLLLAFSLGSCTSNEDDDTMTIELACPKPQATVNGNLVTITWPAIAKTAGYAYRFDQSEYTVVEAEVVKFTGKMTAGTHTFEIYAVGNKSHTTDSAVRTIEFVIDLKLPAPVPSVELDGMNATLSWAAVPGAVGYAYKVDKAAEVIVSDKVLSYKQEFTGGKHTFVVRALGDDVESTDSDAATLDFDVVDTSVGVFLKKTNGAIVAVASTSEGIYSATVDCTINDSFLVMLDGVKYGFLAYGGNGGVGTVNSVYASLPFYMGYTYFVNESLGRLTKEVGPGEGLNPLWVNTGAADKVFIKIDRTNADGIPRYYLKLSKAADASILLEQHFDLMIFGGEWTKSDKPTQAGTADPDEPGDGTLPGTPKGASYSATGTMLLEVSEAYRANRGIADWTLVGNVYELPGSVRLCNSRSKTGTDFYGKMTSPALASLTGSANVTVAFDGLRFGGSGNIAVKVVGAGTITSASVLKDGAGSAVTITPESDGKSFLITLDHCSKHENGAAKTYSNFTFAVQGAASDTQICWDANTATTSTEGRYCLDNIVIRKN